MRATDRIRTAAYFLIPALLLGLLAIPGRSTREVGRRRFPERIPVRFWHMWSAEWKDVVDRIVDRYNRSQAQYEVIALSVPSTGENRLSDTKFLLGAVGGDPPDVMAQWNPVIPSWANNGLLMSFEELMSPGERATFEREAYPIVRRIGRYRGKTYGIPTAINFFAIYYLPEHFREAGLNPDRFPATLEELTQVAYRLTRRNAAGQMTRMGMFPTDWPHMAPLFGGGFYDFASWTLTLDTTPNRAAIEYLVDYRRKLGYDEVVRFQAGLNTLSFSGGWPFIGGAYSITVDGQWRVEQLAKYAPKLEYRTAPIPAPRGGLPGAGYSNGNFMVIPRSAKQKAGAWEFVKFWSGISDPERAAEFYTWGGWLPISDRIARAPAYQAYIRKYPQFKTFVDLVSSDRIQAAPPVAYQVFVMDQVRKEEDLALRGMETPDQAMTNLVTQVEREKARRRELGYRE